MRVGGDLPDAVISRLRLMEDETPLHVPLGSSQLENLALAIKSFFMCGWLGDGLLRFPFKRELAMRVEVG